MLKYEKFFGKEWAEMLAPFLISEEYNNIGKQLVIEANKGFEITPLFKNIYRAFLECPYNSLHTIVCGMDK